MADNTNNTTIRISADTSGVDTALTRSAENMENLKATAKEVGRIISNEWKTMQTALNADIKAIDEFRDEISHIGDSVNDFNMNAIQKEIEKTTKKLDSLLARKSKMQALGADESSKSFQSLQYDIEATKNSLTALTDSVAGATLPTEDYEKLKDTIASTESTIESLKQAQATLTAGGATQADAECRNWRNMLRNIKTG
jgi:phage-related minor tail protein